MRIKCLSGRIRVRSLASITVKQCDQRVLVTHTADADKTLADLVRGYAEDLHCEIICDVTERRQRTLGLIFAHPGGAKMFVGICYWHQVLGAWLTEQQLEFIS